MLCTYYDACSGFPVLVIPEAAFLAPLLMSFLALIKPPLPTCTPPDVVPRSNQATPSYFPRDVDPSFRQNAIS